jgi:hypothetical protein
MHQGINAAPSSSSTTSSGGGDSSSNNSAGYHFGGGNSGGGGGGDELHPRSVLAFCKYFGESVVGSAFDINVEVDLDAGRCLTELASSLVFQRIEPIITNYLRKVKIIY